MAGTLVVQIPAYNEAENIAATIADVPKQVPGFDQVHVIVIDDGSTDDTSSIATSAGALKVLKTPGNRGLALAFQRGLQESLSLGADVIVNFDADNQYPGARIPDLVKPIVDGTADMVLGERNFATIPHFSGVKKFLQKFGAGVVSRLARVPCRDATTGFRALSRETAQSLYVAGMFTYTLETLFWAGARRLSVVGIGIEANPKTRESRLFGSSFEYVLKSLSTILKASIRYRALAIFSWMAAPLFLLGFGAIARFLLYHFIWEPDGTGHVQSLILAAILIVVGVLLVAMGFLADSAGTNRRLLEEILTRTRRKE